MPYRRHAPPTPLLIGYDPVRDLPPDHLARLVEYVVEATVVPTGRVRAAGQPPYDPRLCLKVLIYSYCTGVRSSRLMQRHCRESLPYLFLTRGEHPSYRTLCSARVQLGDALEAVWLGLFAIAAEVGIERLGRITVDSTKLRANASPEAVVKAEEYAALRAELERIQAEIAAQDTREEQEEGAGRTELGKTVPAEQMRDILRRVRRQRQTARPTMAAPPPPPGGGTTETPPAAGTSPTLPGLGDDQETAAAPAAPPAAEAPGVEAPATEAPAVAATPPAWSGKLRQQIAAALEALTAAETEGRAHLCVTDPDARMMYGQRERQTRECHSFEVAVDQDLLVAAQATQEGSDHVRLAALVEAARAHEPGGVVGVDGDSGYYDRTTLVELLQAGVDLCIPDAQTACDLHRGQPIGTTRGRARGSIEFTYDPAADLYCCPEGNTLRRRSHAEGVTTYRATQPCATCPLRDQCLTQKRARFRTLKVVDDAEILEAARQQFATAEHQARYRHRGEQVETIFGFLRGTLGFTRWLLRGAQRVACEAQLFAAAYQFRKVLRVWAG